MRKVFYGLMVIAMGAMVFATSCSKSGQLKLAVETMRKTAGMPTTQNGMGVDVKFDEATNTVEYLYDVPAEKAEAIKMVAGLNGYREAFLYALQQAGGMSDLAKLILGAEGSLKYTYNFPGDNPIVLAYGKEDLQNLADGKVPEAAFPTPPAPQEPEAVPAEEAMEGGEVAAEVEE